MSQNTSDTNSGFSSFFGAIKGALFEDEAKPGPKVMPASEKQLHTSSVEEKASGPSVKTEVTDESSSAMTANMMAAVMSKTTAYTALVEAITPLEQFLPDESARYKAAFSIVGKTRTVEQIVHAIDLQHMAALDAEVQRFNAQAQKKEALEIADRQRQIESLQFNINSANEESVRLREQTQARLAELQEMISSDSQKVAKLEAEVAQEATSMTKVAEQFNAAVSATKAMLTDAKAKVLRYLSN